MKISCYFLTLLLCFLFHTNCGQNNAVRPVPSDTLLNHLAMMSGFYLSGPGSEVCDNSSGLRAQVVPLDIPALYPDYGLYITGQAFGRVVLDIVLSVNEDRPGVLRGTPYDFAEPRSNPGVFDEDFLTNLQLDDLMLQGEECTRFYTRPHYDFFTGSFPNCTETCNREVPVYTNTADCHNFILDRTGDPAVSPNSQYRRCERYALPASWLEGACFIDACA